MLAGTDIPRVDNVIYNVETVMYGTDVWKTAQQRSVQIIKIIQIHIR